VEFRAYSVQLGSLIDGLEPSLSPEKLLALCMSTGRFIVSRRQITSGRRKIRSVNDIKGKGYAIAATPAEEDLF
jgi:hypothetical protein